MERLIQNVRCARLRDRLRERGHIRQDVRVELGRERSTSDGVRDGIRRARRGRGLRDDLVAPVERADGERNGREGQDGRRLALRVRVLDKLEDREDKDDDNDEPEENTVIDVGTHLLGYVTDPKFWVVVFFGRTFLWGAFFRSE